MGHLVHVVGVGADGWDGLPHGVATLVREADVVLGGARHLAMLADAPGQRRVAWPSPLRDGLPALLDEVAGSAVVALASGDPLVSGIGATLIGLLGPDAVVVHPHVSSVALAAAALRWPAETYDVVSLVGRDLDALHRWLAPGRRLILLSSDGGTPADVAALLARAGWGASPMTVLADLGAPTESRTEVARAVEWSGVAPALNVVGVTCRPDPEVVPLPTLPGLPDESFEHDGQLSKRDVRASALSRLAPAPGELLWDVGAGAGSVAVEWMRAHPRNHAVAVESHPERAERIVRNAAALGVPGLDVVVGSAPEALQDLPAPDAVHVGGGTGVPGLVERCRAAVRPGGRLVAHAVTLESEAVLVAAHRERGGELVRISVERAAPLGGLTGWTPARAVVQWTWRAP